MAKLFIAENKFIKLITKADNRAKETRIVLTKIDKGDPDYVEYQRNPFASYISMTNSQLHNTIAHVTIGDNLAFTCRGEKLSFILDELRTAMQMAMREVNPDNY